MVDPAEQIDLPGSVERMLTTICERHSVPSPNIGAKRELASLGEEASLAILNDILGSKQIRSLSGFIFYMAKRARGESVSSPASRPSPSKSGSPFSASSPGDMRPQTSRAVTSLWRASTSGRLPDSYSLALAELEFKKSFLVLSYAGRKRLEDVIKVDDILKFKDSPKARFESDVWQSIGQDCIEEKDRRKNFDLDHEGAFLYRCLVDSEGNCVFKGPYYDKRRTHLQKVLGDDNVLLVKFSEEEANGKSSAISSCTSIYNKIAEEGIWVGRRKYHFFVFKDGGEEKNKDPTSSCIKCYFVCMASNALLDLKKPYPLFGKSIHEARCVFMHVHTVQSLVVYMKRFSLILSKTIKLDVDFASVDVQMIRDEPCLDENGCAVHDEDGKLLLHTDGTGFLSEDLALKCPSTVLRGMCQNHGEIKETLGLTELEQIIKESESHIDEPPLLMQVRLFHNGIAAKGTLLVNKQLPSKTIQIRPSMVKVNKDPELQIPSANSLEIVSTSNRPSKAFLSRSLIAHFNYGGVPKEYFMELLMNALEDARNVHSSKRAALSVALYYGDMDDFLAARMILCGMPLEEPYLQRRLSVLAKEEKKGLKGGRLPIGDCFNVMGTADPTGILKRDEVCVILDNGQISGKVLVYRHPGLHLGDIHILTATYVKELENIVGNSKYAIFFPTKGSRSLADEMAGGDFDGDMFWVSRNPKLLDNFKPSEPWKCTYSAKNTCLRKPTDFTHEQLERELFQQFLSIRFQPSYAAGIASDSWLSFMDRLLVLGDECAEEKECLKKKMLQLIDIYYDALDAPKTRIEVKIPNELKALKFPHFMEKTNSHTSTSILGLIYDKVDLLQNEDFPSSEVWKLPCFDVEVPPTCCLVRWDILYRQYRSDMSNALKDKHNSWSLKKKQSSKCESADEVIDKFKKELYHAPEFGLSKRNEEEIFNDALAIYHLAYDYAKQVNEAGRCSFAWKIAGQALCKLYLKRQKDEPIMCSKSVIREVLN
ncbi:hypothetical protein NE237_028466 [Protea cynaroides]|uniref:RNA-dependent RNA polymerase n=1 Tax=Protea cynaroides TaxID=273540 RepID=A0A9Q0JSW4_9MAGN|nr:hypothetical protein NE237_028466 [Protea cynaroides]